MVGQLDSNSHAAMICSNCLDACELNSSIFIAAIAAGAPIVHAGDGLSADGAIGHWRLSAVGGKVGCTISLTDHERLGGRDLRTPAACQRAFPSLRDFSLWNLDGHGVLRFSDSLQRHFVEFSGPIGGPYAATAPDGRRWRLTASFSTTPGTSR